MGSPPPTRGTLHKPFLQHLGTGITPAYAGNTRGDLCRVRGIRDHPRLRGEHLPIHQKIDCSGGSPPPTRGTPFLIWSVLLEYRITPAYAGNTKVCIRKLDVRCGSPPPTRGTHEEGFPVISKRRITPAYAGNTNSNPFPYACL